MAEASTTFELGMYVEEASRLTGPLGAFHSFHHALRLATAADYPALIDVGLGLGSRLLAASSWDYADWVGAAVARLSDACERPMERVKALRIQGIASSRLGAIGATVEYFETALNLLPRFDDALLKAQVRMSFGLSLMDLLAHWETLDVEGGERPRPACTSDWRLPTVN